MGAQSKEVHLPPWGYAVAGATGAVIANALVYPLDMYVCFYKPTHPICYYHTRPQKDPRVAVCH